MERLAQIPPDWAKLHRQSAGAMLLAEERAIANIRRASRAVLAETLLTIDGMQAAGASAKTALFQAVQSGGKRMQSAIAASVVTARDDARRVALARLDREMTLLERMLGDAELGRPDRSDGGEDAAQGDAAAASYSAAWTAALLAVVLQWADDPSGAPPLRAAADLQDYRLRRIAATEVPRAYNDEHDEGVGWIAETYKNERWLAAVVKRWDAQLDRKVCDVCAGRDGNIVVIGTRFAGGDEPGNVHPMCRCLDTMIVLPARLRELVPGRYTDDEAA